jgi:hypothetical protein
MKKFLVAASVLLTLMTEVWAASAGFPWGK